MKRLRCAIYTRKSSEEGLEQEFNSLHAQREACEAFIRSQKHEGWGLIATPYDDGGISGGTMVRPALQQLLKDIEAHKIDVIVVYKVDRLTRSLADFARMVELFDKHSVSFVSVTQQFNTTSSMGRLTLNVLLSFAQFEREVTGERIRDKIKASKQKGMWMGGVVPLGYKVEDRSLLPNPTEMPLAQHLFARYLVLGSVLSLQDELNSERKTTRNAHHFSRGMLYNLLSNPIYIGKIRHKDIVHDGLHEGIINVELWDAVQAKLAENRAAPYARREETSSYPLLGKLYDAAGVALATNHAKKGGKRYCYYISRNLKDSKGEQGWRIPAAAIESTVSHVVAQMLSDTSAIQRACEDAQVPHAQWEAIIRAEKVAVQKMADGKSASSASTLFASLLKRAVLYPDGITITLSLNHLAPTHSTNIPLTRRVPMQMKRRGVEMRLIIPNANSSPANHDHALIRSVAQAHRWFEELLAGDAVNIQSIAQREGMDKGAVSRTMRLVFLAPDIIERILAGTQPADLNRYKMLRLQTLPESWQQQRAIPGFA